MSSGQNCLWGGKKKSVRVYVEEVIIDTNAVNVSIGAIFNSATLSNVTFLIN